MGLGSQCGIPPRMTNPLRSHMLLSFLTLFVLAFIVAAEPARANGSLTVTGRWAGVAFANSQFDLDGDGVPGRQFDFRAFDELPFSGIEGVLDSTLVGFGCGGPGSIELKPLGTIIVRGRLGEALYAAPDPAGPNLCFDPANPSETLQVVIQGGTGPYAGSTGTGTFVIHDTVRLTRPVNVPGVGVVPAPTVIDSRGDFTLSIH